MVELRQVETFDEAAFAALTEPLFGTEARQRCMRELIGAEADGRNAALPKSLPKPERIRIGAVDAQTPQRLPAQQQTACRCGASGQRDAQNLGRL
jgi:hypothetical protein